MATMTPRERVRTVLTGAIPDRVPLSDSYWVTTVERWRSEGLPVDAQPGSYFGTDEIVFVSGDYSMQFPERILEETGRSRLYWDSDGALKRDLHTPEGWTSQWLEFTVASRRDWKEHRERMAYNDSRISDASVASCRAATDEGKFVCYSAHACFHPTWMRIGFENELVLMLEDPAFIDELFEAHATLVIELYEGFLARGCRFDGVRLADDLGYRTSTLISPNLYRELVFPHHKRLCDRFAHDGIPTMIHSDGNVSVLIPHFIDAGFRGLHPLEVKAGMDLFELKSRYGSDLVLYGNIDARALAGTRDDIEREIEPKLSLAHETGGYLFHSDHSVPPDVSWAHFRHYLDAKDTVVVAELMDMIATGRLALGQAEQL